MTSNSKKVYSSSVVILGVNGQESVKNAVFLILHLCNPKPRSRGAPPPKGHPASVPCGRVNRMRRQAH